MRAAWVVLLLLVPVADASKPLPPADLSLSVPVPPTVGGAGLLRLDVTAREPVHSEVEVTGPEGMRVEGAARRVDLEAGGRASLTWNLTLERAGYWAVSVGLPGAAGLRGFVFLAPGRVASDPIDLLPAANATTRISWSREGDSLVAQVEATAQGVLLGPERLDVGVVNGSVERGPETDAQGPEAARVAGPASEVVPLRATIPLAGRPELVIATWVRLGAALEGARPGDLPFEASRELSCVNHRVRVDDQGAREVASWPCSSRDPSARYVPFPSLPFALAAAALAHASTSGSMRIPGNSRSSKFSVWRKRRNVSGVSASLGPSRPSARIAFARSARTRPSTGRPRPLGFVK